MTGWRCGWMVGPKPVVSAANALQSHATSNVNSITQKAAIAALTGPQDCVTDMLRRISSAGAIRCSRWLAEEPRLRCAVPQGAFYVFPDVSDVPLARSVSARRSSSPTGCCARSTS